MDITLKIQTTQKIRDKIKSDLTLMISKISFIQKKIKIKKS